MTGGIFITQSRTRVNCIDDKTQHSLTLAGLAIHKAIHIGECAYFKYADRWEETEEGNPVMEYGPTDLRSYVRLPVNV